MTHSFPTRRASAPRADISHIIAVAVGNGFVAIALVPQGGEGPDGVCGVHPHALRVFGVADRRCRLRLADLAGDADVALPGAGFYELHDGAAAALASNDLIFRSEEHTSELQSLMRISYAVFCLKKKNNKDYTAVQEHTE